jgi:hypothetical protein
MRSFAFFIGEPRVGVEDYFIKRNVEWLVVDGLQWRQCCVPEWNATCDYFFNGGIESTVLRGMKVIDIARNPKLRISRE